MMVKGEFDCLMIVNRADNSVKNFICQICPVEDIDTSSKTEEIEALRKLLSPDDFLVIDGYEFDEYYQLEVKKMVKKLIAIDDLADNKFAADIIINHGDISILPAYQKKIQTKIYSGFNYLIVRPEFLNAVSAKKEVAVVDTVFVCMGGADPFNITIKVLNACLQCTFLKKIIVVTGSVYKHKDVLQSLIASAETTVIVEHIDNADAAQIVSCIKQSQIAVSTASTIALEICCVKAALLCGTVVDNQSSIHSQLVRNQCCISVGSWIDRESNEIKQQLEILNNIMVVQNMINKQSECVDGKSSMRILNIFRELLH
jgi:spore coat polysaccharide biosynthesis predicted glycosyltransferase SpsG